MYKLNLTDPEQFLRDYWQKQPMIIRAAFDGFVDPLDEHELAGLAQEPDIDARLIAWHNQQWQVNQGPIDDFAPLCVGDWTLLVQGVDRHIPEANQLLHAFSFIPAWRLEDLMVSFSVANGGVGPHIDQYDVFILQGKGSRRWRVGAKGQYHDHYPHPKLSQIEDFSAILDEILLPGDMIYIPPGFPHQGIALEPCMNYSVGFRASTQKELLTGLLDYADQHQLFDKRYADPELTATTSRFALQSTEIEKFRELLVESINSEHFSRYLAHALSSPLDHGAEVADQVESYSEPETQALLNQGQVFLRALDARCVILPILNSECEIWINGHPLTVNLDNLDDAKLLLEKSNVDINNKIFSDNRIFFVRFMSRLLNLGYFYPE